MAERMSKTENPGPMANVSLSEEALREMVKQAVVEALEERRDLLLDVMAEVLEDLAMPEAIKEGRQSEEATRDEVFTILRGPA